MKLAKALVHENQSARALKEFSRAAKLSAIDLERGNSDIFANQWLANELQHLGNDADATTAYRKAIRLKSDNSAAHCQLSLLLTKQGRLSEAIQEYRAALTPAKIQALNDGYCLLTVDQQLDQAVASPGPGHVRAVAELRRLRQEIQGNAKEAVLATADNPQRRPI